MIDRSDRNRYGGWGWGRNNPLPCINDGHRIRVTVQWWSSLRLESSLRGYDIDNCRTLSLNVRSYTYCINLCAEGGYCDPGRKRLLVSILVHKAFGAINTTGDISILPFLSISREIWNKSIIFIGI